MTAPETTVVIPTYGRATFLPAVLHGLSQQTAQALEIIVVDNNPRPRHFAELLQESCPRLSITHEPRNGLQHARNAGIACSRGAIVAFLDDDAVPAPNWLESLVDGMQRYQADAVGGTVSLDFHSHPPDWLGLEERALLSELLYRGYDIPTLTDDMYVVGANFAVRRAAFEMTGCFDPAFDRTASSLRSSGELEYTRRLQSKGRIISFIASACVSHQIPAERLTKRYFYERSFWQGRSDALLEMKWGRPASFGNRNWHLNALVLFKKLRAVCDSSSGASRLKTSLAFVRELGFCLQAGLCGQSFDKMNSTGTFGTL